MRFALFWRCSVIVLPLSRFHARTCTSVRATCFRVLINIIFLFAPRAFPARKNPANLLPVRATHKYVRTVFLCYERMLAIGRWSAYFTMPNSCVVRWLGTRAFISVSSNYRSKHQVIDSVTRGSSVVTTRSTGIHFVGILGKFEEDVIIAQ